MADFTQLKTAIQQYIAQNGNKEITGNLLQTILLAMVQSMGDQAINGVLQMLSNEMIAREHADGSLSQALTAEQQRAIAAETKSAVLDGETKTLVFKNAAGQALYQVSVASLISNGLVDVELDGTNLVMTFHTESGNEEITIPISDIFNPSNYYTKTQVDGLLLPLSRAITRINDTLHEGALYAGYATPETIPTEHEGASLFYIATEAGEYIHFFSNGDIPVVIPTPGIHLIVGGIEADDWNYETIVTFTNNAQFNSSRLITSGGVFNAILPINELLHRNYMLAGVAYTTTIPTEDTNVFYLAGQGGTYTNFLDGDDDPLVLPKGLTVIYRGVEDDGWNYWVVYADNDFINTNRAQALTSDQQTEAQNNMMSKSYVPAQFSGLGKRVLAQNIQQVGGVDKNVMTQAFFQDEQGNDLENTVFVIQYDYTLGGNITIPAGCTLKFDGGSISGAGSSRVTISGDFTIDSPLIRVFDNIVLSDFKFPIHTKWFCYADGVTDDTDNLQNALDSSIDIIVDNGDYIITDTVNINRCNTIVGNSYKYNNAHIHYNKTSGICFNVPYNSYLPYVLIKGVYIHGMQPANGNYYSDTICFKTPNNSGETSIEIEDCWLRGFNYIYYGDLNSYYNRFYNCRIWQFGKVVYNASANNFCISNCRINDGEFVVHISEGDGPFVIERCAIEEISNCIVYCQSAVGQVTLRDNYIEVSCLRLVEGAIKNFSALNNNLQVQGAFRVFDVSEVLCFISIGNLFIFDKNRNTVETCYSLSVNGTAEQIVLLDSFRQTDIPTATHVRNYEGIPDTYYAKDNTVVVGLDPVTEKRAVSLYDSYASSNRPTNTFIGRMYFDRTLEKPIWYKGNNVWVDSTGQTV